MSKDLETTVASKPRGKSRRKSSIHVLETQRLSRFLDVKVERSYQELDDILEEEKKKNFYKQKPAKQDQGCMRHLL